MWLAEEIVLRMYFQRWSFIQHRGGLTFRSPWSGKQETIPAALLEHTPEADDALRTVFLWLTVAHGLDPFHEVDPSWLPYWNQDN